MDEIIPESLSLFPRPPSLLTVNDYTYEQVTTKTALTGRVAQLEFTVPSDKTNYTDLRHTYLLIRGRYVKSADGAGLAANPKVGPVNYPITSMIKSISMAINDVRVTPSEPNAAYIHYLQAFTQGHDAKSSYLTAGLYYEDTMTNANTMNQKDPQKTNADNAAATRNEGLSKRAAFFADGKEVIMLGKLYIPPHNTPRLYLSHLKFDYTLEMAPAEFFSMSTEAAGTFMFSITDAKLLIKRVSVSNAVQIAHEQLLQEKSAVYPLKYIQTKTQSIPADSLSFYWENVFVGEMPTSIIVAFVKSTAYQGSFSENPFFFQNADLSEMTVHLGPKKIPNIEIKNIITRNWSALSYWETLMSMDFLGSNMGPGGFDRESFENASFLLGFDLSRDGNPNAMYANSNYNAGNLALQMSFNSAIPEGLRVIVFGLMHGELEINSNYQARTSY